jgi:hypothetical protein
MDDHGEAPKTFHLGADRPNQRVEETSIAFDGNFDTPYGSALRHAFFQALRLDSKLPLWVRQMEGGSGRKYRYLINNLIAQLGRPRYLEIGSYMGSTLCSALYGNTATATCIDHWKEFGGRPEFDANIARVLNDDIKLRIIESDFRKVDYRSLGTFNVYCFDGPHLEQDQYDALAITQDALDNTYILIVDDWVMPSVRNGTMRGLEDAHSRVLASITIQTTQDSTLPTLLGSWFSDWHNGYFIAVVTKQE